MKYKIEYTVGNEYHCGCCRQTWDETMDFYKYEDVVNEVATRIGNKHDFVLNEVTPIPESPNDFIHDEVWNEYTVKFDRKQFDADVEKLASELVLKKESEEKKKREEEEFKKKHEQEDKDRREYLRLKSKYEGN